MGPPPTDPLNISCACLPGGVISPESDEIMTSEMATYLAGFPGGGMSPNSLVVEALESNAMIEPGPRSSNGCTPPAGEFDIGERIASIYRNRSRSLSNLFHFRSAGDRAEIVTPFLDPTNSRISVFIGLKGENFLICDGGLAGRIVAMTDRPDAQSILLDMVKDYGLEVSGGSLYVTSCESDLLAKQFRICNALVSLRDRLCTEPLRNS